MELACYSVEYCQSQWVVSVFGIRVLTCKTKKTAFKAAKRATVLLHQGTPAERADEGMSDISDRSD